MPHPLAFWCGDTRDVRNNRLGHVFFNKRRGFLLCRAADLANHDNRFGCVIFLEQGQYIDEVRTGASMFYFAKGDKVKSAAENFSDQVGQAFKKKGKHSKRLAIDKIMLDGFKSLENKDFKIENGEKIMEHARSIKSAEEIKAMRCSISACETSMHIMENKTKPGMTENDIWSILHSENIKRGGEWIETRLLSSGNKTNPWFQECGSRVLQNNEIVAFDTDLVGCYSICTDISRTWWIGDQEPTN